ncbi:MAG: peptidase S8, partial [bacterium]|nr:peptidase S8 [bacterium]
MNDKQLGFPMVLLVALLTLAVSGFAADFGTSDHLYGVNKESSFVPGELVVTFAEGITTAGILTAINETGGNLARRSSVNRARIVVSVPPSEEDDYISAYKNVPGVEIAEKNSIFHALWTPNDPNYSYQWHYNKADFIYAEPGWDVERGEGSVVVAVVDTGVAYENYAKPGYELGETTGGDRYVLAPDLVGTTFVAGYDFVHGDDHPNDQNGHGTHVAGTVAQTTDNGLGVAGLAHGCSIMPVQVLDYSGAGTLEDVADGVDYARQNGANVINMSLGGTDNSDTLRNACDAAEKAGLVVVAATGNSGVSTVFYPAAYDSVIAVGAVDYNGDLTYYSNYGDGIEVVAPGGDTSVDLDGDGKVDGVLQMTFVQMYYGDFTSETLADTSTFEYKYLQGTSMASPHVAALAALLMSNGSTSATEVRRLIRDSATDKGSYGYDTSYGYGLINCEGALLGIVSADECGDCSDLGLAHAGLYFAIFVVPYGFIFLGRGIRKR